MIKYENSGQLKLEFFKTEFEEKLNPNNKWVKLSELVPWNQLAIAYYKSMSEDQGRPTKDARIVIGALIIKHSKNLSDEDTISEIQENPYLQYFLGLDTFTYEPIFAPTLFVEIRKRLGQEFFETFYKNISETLQTKKGPIESTKKKEDSNSNHKDGSSGGESKSLDAPIPAEQERGETVTPNSGSLIVDATVAEQQISFPTDLSLLNSSREILEEIIDEMHSNTVDQKKPRTRRNKARTDFLSVSKQKRPGYKKIRIAIRKQLQYVKRDIGFIEAFIKQNIDLFECLPNRLQERYKTILKVYQQQNQMYQENCNRCDDRIVSLSQPHVRPMVRGKAGKNVEFGSKISIGVLENGLSFVDTISWDNYNESTVLKEQVENFKNRFGHYPKKLHADQIYGTKENREFLTEKNIEYVGKPLGRKKLNETPKERNEKKKSYAVRNKVEGKFGEGKNKYRLGKIKAKTDKTSEAWIKSVFMVMNLAVLLRFFLRIFFKLKQICINFHKSLKFYYETINQIGILRYGVWTF